MNPEKKTELIFHVRDIFTREYFDKKLNKIVHKTEASPICTLMFKKINDTTIGMTYSVPNLSSGDTFIKATGVKKVTGKMNQIDHYAKILNSSDTIEIEILKEILPTKVLRNYQDYLNKTIEYFEMKEVWLMTTTDSNFENQVALVKYR